MNMPIRKENNLFNVDNLSLFVLCLAEMENREFSHIKIFETCAGFTKKIDINEESTFSIHTSGGPITDVCMEELRAETDLHVFTRNFLDTGLLSYEYDSQLVLVPV